MQAHQPQEVLKRRGTAPTVAGAQPRGHTCPRTKKRIHRGATSKRLDPQPHRPMPGRANPRRRPLPGAPRGCRYRVRTAAEPATSCNVRHHRHGILPCAPRMYVNVQEFLSAALTSLCKSYLVKSCSRPMLASIVAAASNDPPGECVVRLALWPRPQASRLPFRLAMGPSAHRMQPSAWGRPAPNPPLVQEVPRSLAERERLDRMRLCDTLQICSGLRRTRGGAGEPSANSGNSARFCPMRSHFDGPTHHARFSANRDVRATPFIRNGDSPTWPIPKYSSDATTQFQGRQDRTQVTMSTRHRFANH